MSTNTTLVLATATFLVLGGCLAGSGGGGKAEGFRQQGRSGFGDGLAVPPGNYRFDANYAQVLAPGPYEALPFERAFLRSDLDGVIIEIGVWRPNVPEGTKVPLVVQASSYYGTYMGTAMYDHPFEIRKLTENLLPHGYAIAGISSRGTGYSGGCMDLMGKKEVADLDQAITWLAQQEWSDGNVGMIGKSYPGSTPWAVASTGNPYLKTIVPISGWPDNFELMYRNGTAEIRSWVWNPLYYSFFVKDEVPAPTPEALLERARFVQEGQCPDHAVGLAAMAYAGTYGERDPMGYWAERNLKPAIRANYRGSIWLVHGLQDWNIDPGVAAPFVTRLNESGVPVHWLLGQWEHDWPDTNYQDPDDPNMRWDWAQLLLNWMDYWLKGHTTVDIGPPVQVLDSDHRWRADDSFPPRDAAWKTFHLGPGETLAEDAPPNPGMVVLTPLGLTGPMSEQLRSAPGHSADFFTAPQDKELLISGLPRVHVTITPTGPTGHLAAWLYAVDASGSEKLLGWTTMNLLFADGSEKATPLTPNQRLVAKMEIQPLDGVVPEGSRLMLRIWQYRDDPDASGTDVHGRLPPVAPEPVRVNFGGDAKSTLEIPTIQRGPDSYFEPPHPGDT